MANATGKYAGRARGLRGVIMGQKKGFKHSQASRQQMSNSHTGKKLSESHRKNLTDAVRIATSKDTYKDKMRTIKKGVAMPVDSLSGASPSNKLAKDWWFIKNKVHYRFRSLNHFVRTNTHLFTKEELTEYKSEGRAAKIYRATVMLRNLHLLDKDGNPRVPRHEWNGWTIGEKWYQGYYNQFPDLLLGE